MTVFSLPHISQASLLESSNSRSPHSSWPLSLSAKAFSVISPTIRDATLIHRPTARSAMVFALAASLRAPRVRRFHRVDEGSGEVHERLDVQDGLRVANINVVQPGVDGVLAGQEALHGLKGVAVPDLPLNGGFSKHLKIQTAFRRDVGSPSPTGLLRRRGKNE